MAPRIWKKLLLGSVGAASLVGLLYGGVSQANSNCAECDLLTVHRSRPESATLGGIGGGNFRDGINIASVFNQSHSFDRQGESPMAAMLDPRRNPYLAAQSATTQPAYLFAPWGSFAARPQDASNPAVLFPTRVQPFWGVSQGYTHLNTSPWATMTFGSPELNLPMLGARAL